MEIAAESVKSTKSRGNPNMRRGRKSVNPHGRPPAGFQSFKDRLTWWLENKTIGEIESLVSNPKAWKKLPSIDAMVARRIHAAAEKNGTHDFVAVLDRLLGKPAMTAELNVTHQLGDRLIAARRILEAEFVVVEDDNLEKKQLQSIPVDTPTSPN